MHISHIAYALLFLSHISPVSAMNTQNKTSWLSPSFYTNLIYKGYQNALWFGTQMKALQHKMTDAQFTQEKWDQMYQKKERTQSQSPISNAVLSAQKFKTALEKAAAKSDLMKQFATNPEKFLFGASSSSYQFEGGLDDHNASAAFYKKLNLPVAGDAINFWKRYRTDIAQLKKELGINSFRISIAWDRVEPTQGNYDQNALNTYYDIIKTLKENSLEPIVVLHHYTIPTWFAAIGGFEKKKNIAHFVNFAKKMYEALYENVTYWSTYNAIEGYAFKGYQTGDGPPGIKDNRYLTQKVMVNMLEAHVQIYQAIKNETYGLYTQKRQVLQIPMPLIGIQKNIVFLDPQEHNYYHIKAASGITSMIGEGLQNKGFFDFFTTGIFNIYVPQNIYHDNPLAPQSIDWIGLNIYSNMHMRLTQKQQETDSNKQTANLNYRDYPEGIYRAIKIIYDRIAKPLHIPIIITENGIATNDNLKRTRFFQRTLYTIRKCIEEGYPIIGYTPWASHDNYEWPSKDQPEAFTTRRYGFFEVNFDAQSPHYLNRTLKQGSHYYRDFITAFFKKAYKPEISSKNKSALVPQK